MTHEGNDFTGFHRALAGLHSTYRNTRLTHSPPDELISDVVTARTLRPHIARSALFFVLLVVVSLVSFVTWIIAIAAAEVSVDPFTGEARGGTSAWVGVSYFMFALQVVVLLTWIVALFLPLHEPIAEYGLLIEGRAPAYAVAYWWIMDTMRRRQSPFRFGIGRVSGLPVMHLVHGRENGLVMVRPVGTDLFVGWTMWRQRSTVVMIGHLFRDMFQSGLAGYVRGGSSRAIRELIHSVTREGVQAAILRPPVSEEAAQAQLQQLTDLDAPAGSGMIDVPRFEPPAPPTGPERPEPSSGPSAR